MVKMTLSLPPEVIDTLRQKADAAGLLHPSTFARAIILRELKLEAEKDSNILRVPVKNYSELKAYVEAKKLGSIEVLATFAMEQYMTRYPLKTAEKAQGGKSIDN